MNDQRGETGPLLGGEDLRDGLLVGGVGAQAVNSFGGKGDETALANRLARQGNIFGAGGEDSGVGLYHVNKAGFR